MCKSVLGAAVRRGVYVAAVPAVLDPLLDITVQVGTSGSADGQPHPGVYPQMEVLCSLGVLATDIATELARVGCLC